MVEKSERGIVGSSDNLSLPRRDNRLQLTEANE